METSVTPVAPRPLDLGEILDRAVTLFVRNALLLCGIEAIAIVPLMIFSTLGQSGAMYAAIQRALTSGKQADIAAILTSSRAGPYDFAVIAVALLVTPWIAGAIVYAAGRLFAGEPVTVAQALRGALARYWTVLFAMIINLVLISLVLFALVLAFAVLVGFFVGLAQVVHFGRVAGVIFGIVIMLVFLVGVAALSGWAFTAVNLTFVAAVMERRGIIPTAFSGFGRVFARGQRWRSLVAGIVILVLFVGIDFVGMGVGVLLGGLTKGTFFIPLFTGVARTVAGVLTTVMVTILYFDVRLRREGQDLLANA